MNTLVNFELAKLLKEKGFDLPCQYLRVGGKYRINNENEGDLFNNKYPSTQIPNDWFLCPTITDVVMWLYEKHNIWISVDTENDKDTWFHTISYNKSETIFGNYNTYNSPTETYEAAIEYTLNNLL